MIKRLFGLLLLLSIGLIGQGLQQVQISLIPAASDAETGSLLFRELRANGSNYTGFRGANSITANLVWTLPATDSAGAQCLQSNGSGVLSWAACSGVGVGGSGTTNRIAKFTAATTIGDGSIVDLGSTANWQVDADGTFKPSTTDATDIGATANRVRKTYTNEIDMGNDVVAQKLLLWIDVNDRYGSGIAAFEHRLFFPSDAHMSIGTISTADGTTWTERVRIDNAGNLDVAGNITFTTNDKAVFMEDAAGTAREVLVLDGSNDLNVGLGTLPASGGDLVLWSRGASAVEIGTVGATTNVVGPVTDDTWQFGTTANRWKAIYAKQISLYTIGAGVGQVAIQAAAGGGFFNLRAAASSSVNYNIELPAAAPTGSGKVLQTTSTTATEWADAAASTLPVIDTTSIVEGSADGTKELRFEVDGFTTGTIRVLTPQNADYTIAGTNIAQTFSANQTFAGNILADVDNTRDIGTAGIPFNSIFADDISLGEASTRSGIVNMHFSGDATVRSLTARATNTIETSAHIKPDTAFSKNLGDANLEFSGISGATLTLGRAGNTTGQIIMHSSTAAVGSVTLTTGVVSSVAVLQIDDHTTPTGDNSFDLGASSLRWRNVYGATLTARSGAADTIILNGGTGVISTLTDVNFATGFARFDGGYRVGGNTGVTTDPADCGAGSGRAIQDIRIDGGIITAITLTACSTFP